MCGRHYTSGVEVEVLGTVQIRRDGRLIDIASLRQRAALGLLALEVGRYVSADRLADALWGARLPRHPEAAVRTVISRLRGLLDPVQVEHSPAGYRLALSAESVDASRFCVPTDEIDKITSLLELWRGDPVPELSDWDDWVFYAGPLRECRFTLEEQLVAHRLEEGATDAVIADLRSLAATQPYRERRWVMLAAALTMRGWSSEAASALDRGRSLIEGAEGSGPTPSRMKAPLVVPVDGSELIGRDGDLALLSGLVADGLVHSVVGAPGVGKTSLVREVAARSPVPAHVVDLAGVSSPDVMISLIANTIGCVDMTVEPPLAGVLRTLGASGPTLLVLDDCDGVPEPVADLALRVRHRCPMTRVVVSTRTPLGIKGEVVHHLSELGADDAKALMRLRLGGPSDAEAISPLIDLLVEHTGGLPLAIELAASEAVLLGVREAAELYAAGIPRGADTIIGRLIERSACSLPSEARSLLFSLAALDGPFSVGCAAHVGNFEVHECARLLRLLGASSMVSRVDADGRPQYRFLPPLQRAVSAMSSEVDRAAAREGLRVHAMSVASRIRAEWIGPRGAECTRLLHRERTALRSAMRAAIDSGDAQCAVAVSASLLEHGFRRVDREVFDWAEAATALPGADRQADAVRAHALAAYGAWYRASREGVARHLASIERCEAAESCRSGFSSALRAVISTFFDNDQGAARHWIAAAQMPDPWWRLYHLGVLELIGIDPGWPQPVGEVASALADEVDDATGRLFVAWGQIGRLKADLGGAVDHLERLLVDARALGDVFITGAALVWLIPARATFDRRAALDSIVQYIDHWLPTGDRIQLLTGIAHLRVLLEQFGLQRAFELADGLVRSRSSTSWHVVETEKLIGHSEAAGGRTRDTSAQARTTSSVFDQAIRALREELVTVL